MRILIISFSARSDGNCDEISKMIQESYSCNCTVFRFSQQQIHPCGGCCYECFGKENLRAPKKFIVISNTNQDHFRQILSQNVCSVPEILFLSAKKFGRISIRGDLLTSEAAVSDIRHFVSKGGND